MTHQAFTVPMAVVLLCSLATSTALAEPPRPGTEDNGLSRNESATLWSRDADNYITQSTYHDRYGERRPPVEQTANGTDITFKRPPETAATWTRNDFKDLTPGDEDTSIYPPHADLEDGVFIEDAHATIFAVHPSTRGHLRQGATPLYIAPNGTLRGFVDYRVRIPAGNTTGNRTVEWAVMSHDIEEVRLKTDGDTVIERDGSHTPILPYAFADDQRATVTFEADISVRLRKTIRINRTGTPIVEVTRRTDSVTVADTTTVEIYDLTAYPYYASYPNGDVGVAVFQSRPWQGYTLTKKGSSRVRGVWRFYTARDTDWDTLVRSNRTHTSSTDSDAIPVYVNAYPSRIGPRTEPVRTGPQLVRTWGNEQASPVGTLGENVHVEVVDRPYTSSHGVAVRTRRVDRDALEVHGIVRGVDATLAPPTDGSERALRRSNLTVEVLQRNASHATLRVELRDAATGDPISLVGEARRNPLISGARHGYIAIGDRRVKTNVSGMATVTVAQPGIYRAEYHPGSWLTHDPAYVGDTAAIRWHPLTSIDAWVALLVEFLWRLIPFLVMYYAGRRLLLMLGPETLFRPKP